MSKIIFHRVCPILHCGDMGRRTVNITDTHCFLQLTQLETKLIQLNRGLPFDPSRKDIAPLADSVYEAIAKVREYVLRSSL